MPVDRLRQQRQASQRGDHSPAATSSAQKTRCRIAANALGNFTHLNLSLITGCPGHDGQGEGETEGSMFLDDVLEMASMVSTCFRADRIRDIAPAQI